MYRMYTAERPRKDRRAAGAEPARPAERTAAGGRPAGRRPTPRASTGSFRSSAAAPAGAITDVKQKVRHCSICYNLADADPCPICGDPARDHGLVMVVEQPKDLIALEQTGIHKGVYHVLLGRLS